MWHARIRQPHGSDPYGVWVPTGQSLRFSRDAREYAEWYTTMFFGWAYEVAEMVFF